MGNWSRFARLENSPSIRDPVSHPRKASDKLRLSIPYGQHADAVLHTLSFASLYQVGVQGIEPCLTAPKAVVLPVYDTPIIQPCTALLLHFCFRHPNTLYDLWQVLYA